MKSPAIPLGITLLILYTGCTSYCPGKKLFVDVWIQYPGDSVSIFADSSLIATRSSNELVLASIRDKRNKVAEICTVKDSLAISIFYNSRDTMQPVSSKDTSFYIHPKEIKGFSVATDYAHVIRVFLDDNKVGYGVYEPNSR